MKPFGPEVCQSVWQSSRSQFRIQHAIRVALILLFLLPPVLHAQANQRDFSRKVITRQVPEYPSVGRLRSSSRRVSEVAGRLARRCRSSMPPDSEAI
jgi:hypothetical protein